MDKKTVVLVLVLLIGISFASAFTYVTGQSKLIAQDCTFSSSTSSAGCGATVSYSCLVKNAYSPAGNTTVYFLVNRAANGKDYTLPAYPVQVIEDYIKYAGSIVIDPLTTTSQADSFTIKSINLADVSNSASCVQTGDLPNPYDVAKCYIKRLTTSLGSTIPLSCSCEGLLETGVCTVYDTMNISFLSNSDVCASDQDVLSCSYCDPQWLGWYTGGCAISSDNVSKIRMWGLGSIEYFHASGESPNGRFCCALTKNYNDGILNHNDDSASDCVPPQVYTESQSCELDAWLGRGKSPDSYGVTIKDNAGINKGAPSFYKLDPASGGSDKIQALTADFDGDGFTEIFTYQQGTLYKYIVKRDINSPDDNKYGYVTEDTNGLKSYEGQIQFFGQPAVVDLSYSGQRLETHQSGDYVCSMGTDCVIHIGGYKTCADSVYAPCGSLRIAIFGINQTDLTRRLYVVDGTTLGIIYSYYPDAGSYGKAEIALDTGIACIQDIEDYIPVCYFSAYADQSRAGSDSGVFMYRVYFNETSVSDIQKNKLMEDPLVI